MYVESETAAVYRLMVYIYIYIYMLHKNLAKVRCT